MTEAPAPEDRVMPDYNPSGPPSPMFSGIEWAPAETVTRQCKGSDNYPLAWADDDAIYTTYGDGWGFEPRLTDKLGMGFARVDGMPPDHLGVNIRSEGENTGSGRNGKKGSGMVAIDGVLYLWVFHADEQGGQAQLARSLDHAVTWEYADWKFTEFGYCATISFGRDYKQSRDNYIYTFSHNHSRADTPADYFILMRAPKERIFERDAYEFFVKVDSAGQPQWSANIEDRGPVCSNPGACLRSAMSYNPALKRYFWWQQTPNPLQKNNDWGDTRYIGGFGVYDAPEPWGPWTTVQFHKSWDMGPGERAEFPPKWMSADGLTMWLVFSGEDTFSVRKATLIRRR